VAIASGIALSATAAFAFWTTTGGGSGSATAATANGTLSLSASIAGDIHPGSTNVVTYSATNTGTDAVGVGTVHAVVSTDKQGCTASDFSILDTPSGQNIPADSHPHVLTAPGSLQMNNLASNQDACKGAL